LSVEVKIPIEGMKQKDVQDLKTLYEGIDHDLVKESADD
jgi:hypothetical protein